MKHFSIDDFIRSRIAGERGIDNRPPEQFLLNLKWTMAGAERIRACLGAAMTITSGYRCPALNVAVGGEVESQHMLGEAFDFIAPAFGPPLKIYELLVPKIFILGIDQLIHESGANVEWVHVSFTPDPRYQPLKLKPRPSRMGNG